MPTAEGFKLAQRASTAQPDIGDGLQPALCPADLVEVADDLEDDLVPSLRDYRALDTNVQSALVSP